LRVGLKKSAFALLSGFWGFESGENGFVENILQSSLSQSRAFHEFHCFQLLGEFFSMFKSDRLLAIFGELLDDTRLIAQINLSSDDQEWRFWAVVSDFWNPFFSDIFEGRRRNDGKADEENVGLRIRQRPQSVVVLLTRSVEKAESVRFPSNHDSDGVIIEDSGHVLRGEFVRGVGNKETGFADGAIADDHALDRLHRFELQPNTVER